MMDEVWKSKCLLSELIRDADRENKAELATIKPTSKPEEDFFTRLRSYRNWSKPIDVSPWWCSRFGWYCIEKDLLQCIGCRSLLSAHLPSPAADVVLHTKAIHRFRSLLVEAHTNTCSWRTNITGEEECAPNVNNYELALEDFMDRLNSLLPAITEEELRNLVQELPDMDAGLVKLDAVVFALLGWKSDSSRKDTISCRYCLRQVGLWLFTGDCAMDVSVNLEQGTASAPRSKCLDPILQHHRWCPWVMASLSISILFVGRESQDDGVIPTWLALFRLLQSRRGNARRSMGDKPLSSGSLVEHYVLAKRLLDETLQSVDPDTN